MTSGLHRFADLILGLALAIASLPVAVILAVVTLMDTGAPVIYKQKRVGRQGKLFTLYKFRTMHRHCSGPSITASGDNRITHTGKWIRKCKLDELPELINVLIGDMAVVGPRPEVPRFVDPADETWQTILSVRPGITDPVALMFWNEEQELAANRQNVETYYSNHLLPRKLAAQKEYVINRSWRSDLVVIARTGSVFFRSLFMINKRPVRKISVQNGK